MVIFLLGYNSESKRLGNHLQSPSGGGGIYSILALLEGPSPLKTTSILRQCSCCFFTKEILHVSFDLQDLEYFYVVCNNIKYLKLFSTFYFNLFNQICNKTHLFQLAAGAGPAGHFISVWSVLTNVQPAPER